MVAVFGQEWKYAYCIGAGFHLFQIAEYPSKIKISFLSVYDSF